MLGLVLRLVLPTAPGGPWYGPDTAGLLGRWRGRVNVYGRLGQRGRARHRAPGRSVDGTVVAVGAVVLQRSPRGRGVGRAGVNTTLTGTPPPFAGRSLPPADRSRRRRRRCCCGQSVHRPAAAGAAAHIQTNTVRVTQSAVGAVAAPMVAGSGAFAARAIASMPWCGCFPTTPTPSAQRGGWSTSRNVSAGKDGKRLQSDDTGLSQGRCPTHRKPARPYPLRVDSERFARDSATNALRRSSAGDRRTYGSVQPPAAATTAPGGYNRPSGGYSRPVADSGQHLRRSRRRRFRRR